MARLAAIGALPETQWPDDFDLNDEPIFSDILSCLIESFEQGSEAVDLGSGKYNWFLTMLIPGYVVANLQMLSRDEVEALRRVYNQWPVQSAPFPHDI